MKMRTGYRNLGLLLLPLLLMFGCKRYTDCPEGVDLLEQYTIDGKDVAIYADGGAYSQKRGLCHFEVQYFDPEFASDHYLIDSNGVWVRTDDGQLVPTRNRFSDDFEGYQDFLDLFARSVADTAKYWVNFTAQSPSRPEIADYVALRQCILDGTCDFEDNRMEWTTEPGNAANHVLRFEALKPSRNMVTSKMSIESPFPYFVAGMDLWLQADFRFLEGMPYSIVDIENPYFESSPGPRIVIEQGALAWENKFGAKEKFIQDTPVPLPQDRWVDIKIHFVFSTGSDGGVEVWQDGQLVLTAQGRTLPTYHSIQSSLELGISATPEKTILLMDNLRISDIPF